MTTETRTHTPGPWRVQRALAHSDLHIRSEVPNDDLYDIAVLSAKKPTGFPPDTVEANAKLLAAAPDLLEALKRNLPSTCQSEAPASPNYDNGLRCDQQGRPKARWCGTCLGRAAIKAVS